MNKDWIKSKSTTFYKFSARVLMPGRHFYYQKLGWFLSILFSVDLVHFLMKPFMLFLVTNTTMKTLSFCLMVFIPKWKYVHVDVFIATKINGKSVKNILYIYRYNVLSIHIGIVCYLTELRAWWWVLDYDVSLTERVTLLSKTTVIAKSIITEPLQYHGHPDIVVFAVFALHVLFVASISFLG